MSTGKNKSIPMIILRILLLLISGYSTISLIMTKIEHKKQLEQAEQNAKQFIQNKYGFDADIVKVEGEEYKSAYSKEDNKMAVQMKYENKEFYVYVDSKEKSDYGCDSYQYEEIKDAIIAGISDNMPKGHVIDMRIGNRGIFTMYSNALFEKYYDGSNLDEVMDNKFGILEMIFADENIENETAFKKLEGLDIDFKFTSFDTVERLEEFKADYQVRPASFLYSENEEYEIFAPYITNYIEIIDGKKSNINFNTKEYDGFKYCYFPTNVNKFTDSSDNVTVSEGSQTNIVSRFDKNNEADWVQKPISEAYRFGDLYGDVCIYYPLDKLKGYDIADIGAAYYHDSGFVNNWDIAKANICGEYAVFILPVNHQEFMLVDNKGKEEFVPEWRKDKF